MRLVFLTLLAFQRDHRNLARRLRLVVGELRVQLCLPCEPPISLLAAQGSSVSLVDLGADLDGGLRMREQVVIPVRVGRRATFRRENQQAITVAQVHHGVCAALAAFGPRSGKQQQRSVLPHATDLAPIRAKRLDGGAIPVLSISHKTSFIPVAADIAAAILYAVFLLS